MTVKSDLMALVAQAAHSVDLPAIAQAYVPEPRPGPDKHTEFGVLALADGAAGLYYAWLGESQRGMPLVFGEASLVGQGALDLARYYEHEQEADCSIGLAAISAITQSVFRRSGFMADTAANSMGALALGPGDHLGMVGFFPSLVARARECSIRLTVIEKKAEFVQRDALVNVTMDLEQLRACNKIVSTASMLINNTVDEVLGCTQGAEAVVVIGPTAGFFPDPLFARGVTAVGGTVLTDATTVIQRLRNEQDFGAAARKYLINRADYPGMARLLERIASRTQRP